MSRLNDDDSATMASLSCLESLRYTLFLAVGPLVVGLGGANRFPESAKTF